MYVETNVLSHCWFSWNLTSSCVTIQSKLFVCPCYSKTLEKLVFKHCCVLHQAELSYEHHPSLATL